MGDTLASIQCTNTPTRRIYERVRKMAMRLLRCCPKIRDKIDGELKKLNEEFERETINRTKGVPYVTSLPAQGIDREQIIKLVERSVYLGNYDWKNGRVSGCVYRNAESGLKDLVKEVYSLASLTNPLHPDVFPGVCKMEAEVVRIACRLFGGDDNSCGTMTTGGTESILLACKAFRDYAREYKGIKKPEMVVPVTAHSAFDKAAQFLKIRMRLVPVNPDSLTVSIEGMKRAINRNTVLLVCSAPNFPYGTMDNIERISRLGLEHDIPVHVDACLGGFLVCFMRQAGYTLPDFDFRLSGVSSISADTHKYGYAPKGSSVILYRHKKYRHHQFTISTDWPGGIYGSPTVNGSRAGGIIAACWATMMYFGMEGYVKATKDIIDTTQYIERELRGMNNIYVFGTPMTSVIAVGSHDFEIYRLSQALNARGWNLNTLQFPSAIHICVTHVHTEPGVAQQFVDDVRFELEKIMQTPKEEAEGIYALYGSAQTIPDRSVVGDITKSFIDSMYYTPPYGTETLDVQLDARHQNSDSKASRD
ncbi:sphingosine-1-phosphate lyase isoform X2 [Nasonia vitripennis]|uniref:sphinganine-1-phosphate aldolase n=1 Tax=Nasonia vitripennis TaxID=7425 RepID=A0A7M7R3Y5_NASVI|nr:sphingosine-1-phosphate lyase isoform X2 [Nasonia vitripennis]